MKIPDRFNDTDLAIIDRLSELTGLYIDEKVKHWHGDDSDVNRIARNNLWMQIVALRDILHLIGFDSEGIDHVIGDE